MTARECRSCTLWLMPDEFSIARPNYCYECERARPVVIRVAGIAANALIKCRAASALLNLGYVYAARLVLAGAEDWPSARELRGSRGTQNLVDQPRRRHDRADADDAPYPRCVPHPRRASCRDVIGAGT